MQNELKRKCVLTSLGIQRENITQEKAQMIVMLDNIYGKTRVRSGFNLEGLTSVITAKSIQTSPEAENAAYVHRLSMQVG